jgi:hypothetical protein
MEEPEGLTPIQSYRLWMNENALQMEMAYHLSHILNICFQKNPWFE